MRRTDQGAALAAGRVLPTTITPVQRRRYRTLRVMIRTSGLAATYAFIAAKAGPATPAADTDDTVASAYRTVLDHVTTHLTTVGLRDSAMHPVDVIAWLGNLSTDQYARASNTVNELLTWLSRLADATPDRKTDPTPSEG